MDLATLSAQIKQKAMQLGFAACGIAEAKPVAQQTQDQVQTWLKSRYQATMGYMENHLDKRLDPTQLVENAKSIVIVALNYYPSHFLAADAYQFAYYAYGKDYHEVMKEKLALLYQYIQTLAPTNGRCFSDTAPVLERYWAAQAGIGWIGKSNLLIIPNVGSFFFLGELMIDLPLQYDQPLSPKCGGCTRCLDHCPTHALRRPYVLDSNRCLSYLTIENRDQIPEKAAKLMKNSIYGCDVCAQVCPWNSYATPHQTPELNPSSKLLSMQNKDWHTLTEAQFSDLFKHSAVKRTKYSGLIRNINQLNENCID